MWLVIAGWCGRATRSCAFPPRLSIGGWMTWWSWCGRRWRSGRGPGPRALWLAAFCPCSVFFEGVYETLAVELVVGQTLDRKWRNMKKVRIHGPKWPSTWLVACLTVALPACGNRDFGVCTNPVAVGEGYDSGLEWCEEGYLHRISDQTCPIVPETDLIEPERRDLCESDEQCGGGRSFCAEYLRSPLKVCRQSCTSDADCDSDDHCVCGERFGRCVGGTSECQSDADCDGKALCIGVQLGSGCAYEATSFLCQSAHDECYADDDCPDGEQCRFGEKGLECFKSNLICSVPSVLRHRTVQVATLPWTKNDTPTLLWPRFDWTL